jgi:very-short-patch-repair endonuclease
LRRHRHKRIAALLETSLPDRAADTAPPVGKAEAHLYEHLCLHFPNRILRRRTLLYDARTYHPDFLNFDPEHRLRIDIELDEAYALRTKLPIHFVDEDGISEDVRRDEAFLEAGWVVMRFSESQAVENAPGCARRVAEVIEQLTGKRTASLAPRCNARRPNRRGRSRPRRTNDRCSTSSSTITVSSWRSRAAEKQHARRSGAHHQTR